jgi:hypothetical protein
VRIIRWLSQAPFRFKNVFRQASCERGNTAVQLILSDAVRNEEHKSMP